ncbi:MAG: hypothetical protein ACJ751_02670 [Niastella sp.]|uniref:hypothetical protein n=1 Tax=Niastella sp. TaxID=1869183 RepID=UPI00389A2933
MLYFKTIKIENTDPEIVEKAVRAFSLKRLTSLDLITSSVSYASEDKYFLGVEKSNDLFITRVRTPIERIFPKLIVRFKKENEFTSYQIRYSLPAIAFWLLNVVGLFADLFYLLTTDDFTFEGLFLITLIIVFFLLFTLLELTFTRNRINKAIEKTGVTEF